MNRGRVSIDSRELLLQRYRDLHAYLCLLGEHITYIHDDLERIERIIKEKVTEHRLSHETSQNDLGQIKERMATKSELNDLLLELNDIIKEVFPRLPTLTSELSEAE